MSNLHVVVGRDLVAIGERRVHGAVRLERANADVQRGRRIPDQHLRRIGRGDAVERRELREAGEQRGLLPDRFVEHTVDHRDARLALDARNVDLELIVTSDVRRRGAGSGAIGPHSAASAVRRKGQGDLSKLLEAGASEREAIDTRRWRHPTGSAPRRSDVREQ